MVGPVPWNVVPLSLMISEDRATSSTFPYSPELLLLEVAVEVLCSEKAGSWAEAQIELASLRTVRDRFPGAAFGLAILAAGSAHREWMIYSCTGRSRRLAWLQGEVQVEALEEFPQRVDLKVLDEEEVAEPLGAQGSQVVLRYEISCLLTRYSHHCLVHAPAPCSGHLYGMHQVLCRCRSRLHTQTPALLLALLLQQVRVVWFDAKEVLQQVVRAVAV